MEIQSPGRPWYRFKGVVGAKTRGRTTDKSLDERKKKDVAREDGGLASVDLERSTRREEMPEERESEIERDRQRFCLKEREEADEEKGKKKEEEEEVKKGKSG